MTITDEMVGKARDAWLRDGMRAALEAVAPMLIAGMKRELDACEGALAYQGAAYALALADRNKLIAQGMREAAKIPNIMDGRSYAAILARAQELDPE